MLRNFVLGASLLLAMTAGAQSQCKKSDCPHHSWMESNVWNNGWNVAAHSSINAKEFHEQYEKNREVWDAMFAYLAKIDLDTLSLGRIDIVPGRCYIKMSEYVPRESEKVNIEQHHNWIDLQYTLSGNEKMGYAKDVTVKHEYNPKKDVAHFNSDNVTYYKAGPEAFYLFFPTDYHQPSVIDGEPVTSRKLVCKIEYVH
ncbi:MAG: YhcH/YjgK/YiaL family protein [Lachnospiraceae bacterium]|nr:YhcH/YjgK/YiaL family protein [Lachnospiraceae bacterium]